MGCCGQCLLISDGSFVRVNGRLRVVEVRRGAQQLALQLFLIADVQRVPLQSGWYTSPNIWEK